MKFCKRFYNININPVLINNLNSNVEAALVLQFLYNVESENETLRISRSEIAKYTGLRETQIKKAETFLKKNELIEIETDKKARFYKVDYQKYSEVIGISIGLYLILKLNSNPKAALLLKYFLETDRKFKQNLNYELPSTDVLLSTGLNRQAQIYARDTLLSYKLLETDNKSKVKLYSINTQNVNKFINTT